MASETDLPSLFTGTHEVQECCEGHGDTHLDLYKKNCKKSHAGFIPINKLSIEHFPSAYHEQDIFDLTKAMADLTVRIAVKFTSPDRPEFIPGTKDPYPCYDSRGKISLKTGTGMITDVTKYTEGMDETVSSYRTCPCPECDHSDTPSKVWWMVDMWTAIHVVFDESEARQSKCRLWFDDYKLPVFNIHGLTLDETNISSDWCGLYGVTHDLVVGEKLEKMLARLDRVLPKVTETYENSSDVDKLTIIVSHPHGCSKQVSIGHWVDRQVVGGEGDTRYTYTTCTCPGSSGAVVYRLGCHWPQHPHCGTNSKGLNYSGVYLDG